MRLNVIVIALEKTIKKKTRRFSRGIKKNVQVEYLEIVDDRLPGIVSDFRVAKTVCPAAAGPR